MIVKQEWKKKLSQYLLCENYLYQNFSNSRAVLVNEKVTWHTARFGDTYSEFLLYIYPSKVHTHTVVNTHTVNTHPEQRAAIYAAAPGEQLGVLCLAQGHLVPVLRVEESAVHSLPPPTIPAGPRLELGLSNDH